MGRGRQGTGLGGTGGAIRGRKQMAGGKILVSEDHNFYDIPGGGGSIEG